MDGGLKLCESKSKEIKDKNIDNMTEDDVKIPTVSDLKNIT